MRLFLAVDVDEAVRRAVAQIVGRVRAAFEQQDRSLARSVKWTDPSLVHVTLHFFGEVDAETAGVLRAACARPWPAAPFDLAFGGLGAFPRSGPARVVWLGVRRGGPELTAVHELARERLGTLPVTLDPRSLSPHLTLGRFRQPPRLDVGEALRRVGDLDGGSCRVSGLTLYSSRLSPDGPKYAAEARGGLAP